MTDKALRSIAIAAVLFYVFLCFLFHPFVADDAFIVGRYALNAAAGDGLVYNVGERVSALTSPLHALIVVAIAQFSATPVEVYRLLAPLIPLLGWGLAILNYRPSPREVAVVSVFALASPFLALWAGGGLETPILAAILTAYVALLFRVARTGEASALTLLGLGVAAALAFLTRFDSILVTIPPMIAILVMMWRRPAVWVAGALSFAISASWLVFARAYYGDFLPTSAYVKAAANALAGPDSLAATVNMVLVTGTAMAVMFLIGAQKEGRQTSGLSPAIGRGAAVSVAMFIAYAIKTSGVHMMFSYRMFVPVLFPLGMVIAAFMAERRILSFLCLQGALQLGVAVLMMTVGMNVVVLRDFGRLGATNPEYREVVPTQYGVFMDTLRQDAADLAAHWAENGDGGTPRLYLHTAGMGYWLPDFYVFELLVSYRHDCYPGQRRVFLASDYVQDLGTVAARYNRVNYLKDRGPGAFEVVSPTPVQMNVIWEVRYRFAAREDDFVLPDRVGGPCSFAHVATTSGG